MQSLRHILPLAIAGAGITVAQLQGGPFWVFLFRSAWLGWAVSIFWEASSVWLWWRGDRTWRHRAAKWVATLALVGGMVAQGAGPMLAELERRGALAATAEKLGDALDGVLEMAVDQKRRGWKETIEKAMDGMIEASGRIAAQGRATAVLQAAGPASIVIMPALYALAILALTTVAREMGALESAPVKTKVKRRWFQWKRFRRDPAPPPKNRGPARPPAESTEKAAIRAYAQRHGLSSQAAVAQALGEPASTLSEYANGKADPGQAARIWKALRP